MTVTIVRAQSPNDWYYNCLGMTFEAWPSYIEGYVCCSLARMVDDTNFQDQEWSILLINKKDILVKR